LADAHAVAQAGRDLLPVLEVLHAQERAPEQDGEHEEHRDAALPPHRGGIDGHGHGEAAADENQGVREADLPGQVVAGRRERVVVERAVDGVGREEAAEEQDLRDQEDPHAERARLLLLLEVGEVVRERPVGRRSLRH